MATEKALQQAESLRGIFKDAHPAVGSTQRTLAAQSLIDQTIPTRKWEAWKYTNIGPALKRDFQPEAPISLDPASFVIEGLEADRLVFVNGRYQAELSSLSHNKGTVSVQSLGELTEEAQAVFEQHFAQVGSEEQDIFSNLNTALADSGVFVHVARNKATVAPILMLHLHDSSQADVATQIRNLFVVEDGAEAKLIEHHVGGQFEHHSFYNGLTEVVVGKNAGLELIKLQEAGDQASAVDTTTVRQADDSRFSIFTITMNGEIRRNNLYIHLDGSNTETHLMGTYLLDGQQHLDNFTQVHHLKPHCFSNELYKGIIDEQATAAFNGKIHVYPDAQKTNAFQSSRNILLSDSGNVFTKPQLEIYADDVKCSHGATTGRLDQAAMFYLMARGIPAAQARLMLVHAFVMEVADHISIEPVRDYIEGLVAKRYA